MKGERFGKFELQERIGVGGMAEVFVARTHGAQGFVKQVVIKRILPAFSEDPEFVRMFINEAHLAARLQHANIVQIFDFDHVDDHYYIAMEWVDGADLRRISTTSQRRGQPIPVKMAVHVGVEALKGLHYAQSLVEAGRPLGLVHRDISPHNLLVSFSGEVKITDFGIAKVAAVASATRTGAVKGKLPYMAPEQVMGRPVDGRTDIFALGVVLWELMAARRLYAGAGTEGELLARVKRAEVPPIREVNPDVSLALSTVLGRMVASEPERRFEAPADALAELCQFATVNDALVVADYLRRLLPAESARQQRGKTEVAGRRYEEAPPDAETRTGGSGAGVEDAAAASEALAMSAASGLRHRDSDGLSDTAGALDGDPESNRVAGAVPALPESFACRKGFRRWLRPDGSAGERRPVRLAFASAVLAVAGGIAGWHLAAPAVGAVVDQDATDPGQEVALVTRPAGARVWVEGVPLQGQTPLSIAGVPGRALRVRAALDDLVAEAELAFERGQRQLVLPLRATRSSGGTPGSTVEQGAGADRLAPAAASLRQMEPRQQPASNSPAAAARSARAGARGIREWGSLNVVVAPWARVKVGATWLGSTPVRDHRIVAGRHWVELVNRELGKRERIRVTVEAGKTVTVRRTWAQ